MHDADGQVMMWHGKPRAYIPGTLAAGPPCHRCMKVLFKGTEPGWERAVEFTPEAEEAIEYAKKCLVIGRMPEDPITEDIVYGVFEGRHQAAGKIERNRRDRQEAMFNVLLNRAGR